VEPDIHAFSFSALGKKALQQSALKCPGFQTNWWNGNIVENIEKRISEII
jgi:hypothetical protein